MNTGEIVDILDDFGEKTGAQALKSEAHTGELRHAGAHVWVYNSKGEILLQLRSKSQEIFPGTLDISAAGHLSAGDTPLGAAIRETKEELGLKLTPEDLRFIGVTRTDKLIPPKNWMHRVFDWNYAVHTDIAAEDFTIQFDELDAVVWVPLDQFEADIRDPEHSKKYSPRPLYLYDLAIFEIRKALAEKKQSK